MIERNVYRDYSRHFPTRHVRKLEKILNTISIYSTSTRVLTD